MGYAGIYILILLGPPKQRPTTPTSFPSLSKDINREDGRSLVGCIKVVSVMMDIDNEECAFRPDVNGDEEDLRVCLTVWEDGGEDCFGGAR